MAKIDVKHAYRSVPIHPAYYQATGCKWQFAGDNFDMFFYDTRVPFRAKSSPEILHRITQAVRLTLSNSQNKWLQDCNLLDENTTFQGGGGGRCL